LINFRIPLFSWIILIGSCGVAQAAAAFFISAGQRKFKWLISIYLFFKVATTSHSEVVFYFVTMSCVITLPLFSFMTCEGTSEIHIFRAKKFSLETERNNCVMATNALCENILVTDCKMTVHNCIDTSAARDLLTTVANICEQCKSRLAANNNRF
jgi:hypothetical protein